MECDADVSIHAVPVVGGEDLSRNRCHVQTKSEDLLNRWGPVKGYWLIGPILKEAYDLAVHQRSIGCEVHGYVHLIAHPIVSHGTIN